MILIIFVLLGGFNLEFAQGLENGLSRTPPMGFMTWQRYACSTDCVKYPDYCISEDLIKRTADAMASRGFKNAGYEYIVIDDCWPMKIRDPKSLTLVPDPKRFPNGMKALGDYVRSKGFKLGIYLDMGTLTCGGYPGSLLYLQKDLETLRSWGTEYIKMDGCYCSQSIYEESYEVFTNYINSTGVPIVFSCSYPAYYDWQKNYSLFNWERLQKNCNLWRMYTDIMNNWLSIKDIIKLYKNHGTIMRAYAGPGSWNDPDMIVIGNGALSPAQERLQFGMWAIFAAPLLLSTNISSLTNEQVDLLQNKMILRINQDPLGKQGFIVINSGTITAWRRDLVEDQCAIAFISDNELGPDIFYEKSLKDLGVYAQNASDLFILTDVFTGYDLGIFKFTENIQIYVPNTGIQMFLVSKY